MIQNITDLYALIDFKLAALIIISAYWVKANFSHVFPKISLAIKIFIWSTALSILYYLIGKKTGLINNQSYLQLIITYFAATSFYELFFKELENAVKNLAGGKKQ